jgi:hypothetical protein
MNGVQYYGLSIGCDLLVGWRLILALALGICKVSSSAFRRALCEREMA